MHIGLMDNNDGLDVRKFTLQEVTFIGCYTYTMVDVRATVNALHSGALGSLTGQSSVPSAKAQRRFPIWLRVIHLLPKLY